VSSVLAVDNLQLNAGSEETIIPVLLTPGTHIIQIGACAIDFLGLCDWHGTAALSGTFAAGETYKMRVLEDPPKRLFADYRIKRTWIEDSAGNPITPVAPMADNNPTSSSVPIFIPVK